MHKFNVPIPPLSQSYWHEDGRMALGRAGHAYKECVEWLACNANILKPLTGDIALHVVVYRPERRGDLDDRLNVVVDALVGIVYTDKSQIVEICAYRQDSPRDGRIEIEVRKV